MRIIAKTLLSLLITLGVSGNSAAQGIESVGDQDMQAMIAAFNTDISELQFLSGELAKAEPLEHEILVYRRDERSFHMLADLDMLVAEIATLPDGSAEKAGLKTQLAELSEGIGNAILNRIEEIRQRIVQSRAKLETLSGGAYVAAQAHNQGLESIRVKYFESLASHIETRKFLDLSSEDLRSKLDPNLYLFAETLAGKIEISGAAYEKVQSRADQNPDNADLVAAMMELESRHEINLVRLESVIAVLDDLGLDSSEYKAVMLQQASNFSVSFFSPKAILSVLKDSWISFRHAIEENAPDLLFKIFIFIAILFVFRLLSRSTKRIVRAATDRSSLDLSELLKNILVSTTGGTVMAIGILMALSQVGISLAPMLAGLGVAGFIVGFALQDTLGNFAAGAMILIYRPFDVDDFVEVTGASGLVKKMNLVSTTITTFDNQTLVVPNSKIWGDVIKNVTAQKERRVDLEFGIGYEDNIELAERVLTDIVTSHEKVLEHPEPTIKLHTLGDSSVNFVVRPWTNTEDYWDVYWDLMREVKLRFDREGISIPYPQRDVHLYPENPAQGDEVISGSE